MKEKLSKARQAILDVLEEFDGEIVPIERLVAPGVCKNRTTLKAQICYLRALTGRAIEPAEGSYRLVDSRDMSMGVNMAQFR